MNPALKSLSTELATDPEGRGYTSMTPAQVAADLNDPRYERWRPKVFTDRTLSQVVGIPRMLEIKAELQASASAMWQYAAELLSDRAGDGVDIADEQTRNALAAMVADTGISLTQAEADAILATSRHFESRAQQIGYNNEIPATWIETIRGETQ